MERPQDESPLTESIQKAIAESGLSLNRIGKEAGVSQAQLSRFVRKSRTLTLPAADKLCVYFNLRLTKAAGSHDQPRQGPDTKGDA